MVFPKNFYWGAATASYQVEGGIENCDWAEAARDKKVPPAGRLADHYNRYEEDFTIAQQLGHNAHRFSIEWARIEPEEGKFDEHELAHYRSVLRSLRAHNLEPFITLWHFTLPLWFSQSGGFERADAPEVFARYCQKVVAALKDDCQHFATINEPNVWAGHGWLYGAWPPFKRASLIVKNLGKDDGSTKRVGAAPKVTNVFLYFKVEKNLAKAHTAAYLAIKKIAPKVQVSIVKHIRLFESDSKLSNILKARIMQYFQWDRYLRKISGSLDEIGLNYYRVTKFGDIKNYLKSDMDWDVYPSGISTVLEGLKKYNLPIFVSEAGLADADDDLRADYITLQVKGVEKALSRGVDVRGHMYWSLIDNYEWALGVDKKFGLVEIDYNTLKRTIRPSAWHYKKLIEKYSHQETVRVPEDNQ